MIKAIIFDLNGIFIQSPYFQVKRGKPKREYSRLGFRANAENVSPDFVWGFI
ncbi:hypothetical protein KAW43_01780 [Candidatus Parcubacteria bacterium]|nr:hypothetical protein [Candidatus Parcubacteria bacterium]